MSERKIYAVNTTQFKNLLSQVRELILSARRITSRSVDTIQVLTNLSCFHKNGKIQNTVIPYTEKIVSPRMI